MASIYTYVDYRQYLRDQLAARRQRNPDYSLRAAAAQIGINSGQLTRILDGQRNLTTSALPRFLAWLKLRPKESAYFGLLVEFNQSRQGKRQRECYERLMQLRAERKATVPESGHAFYREWYLTVLRELVGLGACSGDGGGAGRLVTPAITESQARKGLEQLRRLGFVSLAGDGRWQVRDAQVSTGDTWSGAAIHGFQLDLIRLAGEAIDRFPKAERDFSTVTACLSADGLLRARDVLKRARQEILSIEEQDSGRDRVYQVNMQVFPVSESVRGRTS